MASSGGARLLGDFQYLGVLLIWIKVGQGRIVLSVGPVGGCQEFSSRLSFLFFYFSPFLIYSEILSQMAIKHKKTTTKRPYVDVLSFLNSYLWLHIDDAFVR